MDFFITPKEYAKRFEANAKFYIETEYGTKEQYIENERYILLRQIRELSLLPKIRMEPSAFIHPVSKIIDTIGKQKYINANHRKLEFLESLRDESNSSVPNSFHKTLNMKPTEAVELIRAMEKAGFLDTKLNVMYEIFGKLIGKEINGKRISADIKNRVYPHAIKKLNNGFDEFVNS